MCYLNQRYRGTKYPALNEWLTYVNLLPTEIVGVVECLQTFSVLITMNDKQVVKIPRFLSTIVYFPINNLIEGGLYDYPALKLVIKWY